MCHSLQVWSNRFWKLFAGLLACPCAPPYVRKYFLDSPEVLWLQDYPAYRGPSFFLTDWDSFHEQKEKKNKKITKTERQKSSQCLPPLIMSQGEQGLGVSELASSNPECLKPSLGFWTHSAQSETLVYNWLKIDKASI